MNNKKTRRSLKELFQYYFDLWLSKGAISMVVLLFIVTGVIIVILSVLLIVFCANRGLTFTQALWGTLNHTLDPGVLSGDDGSVIFLFIMLLATLCGVFFTALLIGAINDGISSRMNELSKGLEAVIEKNHVVILGFNESTFIIISELIEAYDNQKGKRNAVVIMDAFDKQEMEERIRAQFPSTGNIKIICRSGDPFNQTDLNRCSIETCKSIIVALDSDFDTIKTIIACTQLLNNCDNSQAFVTAVINRKEFEFAARIAGNDTNSSDQFLSVENDRLELLMLESTISKIMTHTSRQMGLSKVFIEIFDYAGNEFYIIRHVDEYREVFEKLCGKTIREINQRIHSAIAIGVIDAQGNVLIDDPNKVVFEQGCKLIVLEEDDNRIMIGDDLPQTSYAPPTNVYEDKPVTVLIVDCNSKLPTVLKEMYNYLSAGSQIYIAAVPEALSEVLSDEFLNSLNSGDGTPPISINKIEVPNDREEINDVYEYAKLEKLIDDCHPDFLLIMSSEAVDNKKADAKSLRFLLYCKHYKTNHPENDFGVTCEMYSVANQHLADALMASDFVVSRNIAALMMSQIAENRELKDVFENLLVSEGYEIYIKPAIYYLDINGETEVDLFSISEAVAEKHEIFLGYRQNSQGDPILTPCKTENGRNVSLTLHENDQFVVLAEDIRVK